MPSPSRRGSRRPAFLQRSGKSSASFCAIKNWHPAVAECVETKEGDVTFRTLTLKDGAKIKEKLTGTEDLAYTYEIVEGPLPVKNYSSKLWLEVDDEPDRSVIYWQSEFDPATAPAKTMPRRSSPASSATASKASRRTPSRPGTSSIPTRPPDGDDDDDDKK